MVLGYARVSTEDRHLDSQIIALKTAGAGRVLSEKVSGSTKFRPELGRLFDQLRDDDVVVVTKYDLLSRSLQDLLTIVANIRERGAGFRSLAEDIDTTTPAGNLVFNAFGPIAQFERERIAERTKRPRCCAQTWTRRRKTPCPI